MDSARIRCISESCENTILPATAQRTGGYCMRCVQKHAAKERAEYIEKNRRQVDPFAGLTDPADLIIALHTRRKRDPLIVYKPCPYSAEELYSRLSSESIKRLEEAAIAAKRVGDKGFADDIAQDSPV